jgi:hypothetical protein
MEMITDYLTPSNLQIKIYDVQSFNTHVAKKILLQNRLLMIALHDR